MQHHVLQDGSVLERLEWPVLHSYVHGPFRCPYETETEVEKFQAGVKTEAPTVSYPEVKQL